MVPRWPKKKLLCGKISIKSNLDNPFGPKRFEQGHRGKRALRSRCKQTLFLVDTPWKPLFQRSLECPTRLESVRNRSEIQFYGLAIPRMFFKLLLSLEIGLFENCRSISPDIPVLLATCTGSIIVNHTGFQLDFRKIPDLKNNLPFQKSFPDVLRVYSCWYGWFLASF